MVRAGRVRERKEGTNFLKPLGGGKCMERVGKLSKKRFSDGNMRGENTKWPKGQI